MALAQHVVVGEPIAAPAGMEEQLEHQHLLPPTADNVAPAQAAMQGAGGGAAGGSSVE